MLTQLRPCPTCPCTMSKFEHLHPWLTWPPLHQSPIIVVHHALLFALHSMFGWQLGGWMERQIRYAFVFYAFVPDLLICVTHSSLCPTSRSFPKRICWPDPQKQISWCSSTLVSRSSVPSSWVVIGVNNLLCMEEQHLSASFEVFVPSLLLFVVYHWPLLHPPALMMHAVIRSLVSLPFVSQLLTY